MELELLAVLQLTLLALILLLFGLFSLGTSSCFAIQIAGTQSILTASAGTFSVLTLSIPLKNTSPREGMRAGGKRLPWSRSLGESIQHPKTKGDGGKKFILGNRLWLLLQPPLWQS